ncbi:MAG: hypothetical protein WCF16_09915 [Alphaproteobacteria bacterium]
MIGGRSTRLACGALAILLGTGAAARGAQPADDPLLQKCLEAWTKAHHTHGGPLTLFAYQVKDRGAYKLVEMKLGSGEGRTIEGSCRVDNAGEITNTYD